MKLNTQAQRKLSRKKEHKKHKYIKCRKERTYRIIRTTNATRYSSSSSTVVMTEAGNVGVTALPPQPLTITERNE